MKSTGAKKVVLMCLLILSAFGLTACGTSNQTTYNKAIQDDLIKYAEKDLTKIKGDETTAVNEYNDLSSKMNKMKQTEIIDKMNNKIIPEYTKFQNNLKSLQPATKEVQALQATYLSGVDDQLNGMKELSSAIEKGDKDAGAAANSKILQGKVQIEKHRSDMILLAGKNGIKVEQDK